MASQNPKQSLTFLLLGKPGIGKSTLINGLIGEYVAEVSTPGFVTTKGVTRKVTLHSALIHGIQVRIWDTPGLLDPEIDSKEILRQVKEQFQDVDLVLFCINMTETRMYENGDEATMIKMITEILGQDIWNKALITLVRANGYISLLGDIYCGDDETTLKKKYLETLHQWKTLLKTKVKPDISIATAGIATKRKLFSIDKTDWLSNLWIAAFDTLPEKEQGCFALINFHRLRVCSDSDDSQSSKPATLPRKLNPGRYAFLQEQTPEREESDRKHVPRMRTISEPALPLTARKQVSVGKLDPTRLNETLFKDPRQKPPELGHILSGVPKLSEEDTSKANSSRKLDEQPIILTQTFFQRLKATLLKIWQTITS